MLRVNMLALSVPGQAWKNQTDSGLKESFIVWKTVNHHMIFSSLWVLIIAAFVLLKNPSMTNCQIDFLQLKVILSDVSKGMLLFTMWFY